jgi:catechol 2,3-dioxygenase-like lactoylglutathione lyase family enzyme
MITKIHSVPVVVSDQDRALKFYRDVLGFEVTADSGSGAFRWLTVKPKAGQTHIMLTKDSPEQAPMYRLGSRLGTWTGMVLDTDDIRAECARLKAAGVRVTKEPEPQHWGGIEAQFADPDGNTFELVQPEHR